MLISSPTFIAPNMKEGGFIPNVDIMILRFPFTSRSPLGKLVIEVDGGQHYEENYLQKDQERDFFMEQQGLKTLRFNNLQVLQSIDDVIDAIFNMLDAYLSKHT